MIISALTEQDLGSCASLYGALADRMPDVRHWYLLTARDSDASVFYEKAG